MLATAVPASLPSAEPRFLASIVAKLLDEAGRAIDRDSAAAKSCIARAAALLQAERDRREIANGPAAPARGGLAPWQMRRVNAYIDENLDQPIRIDDMTAVIQLSKSYFSLAFRSSFGEPPHAYLLGRRIERAKELMLLTDQPLSQIALACGLCDQAHLSKLFRRATGTSPKLWRRQRCGAPELNQAA
ncbi:MAG TPA: AraC family transcriptional regulator [Aliidongia sp.]|nr:AraC family transcriptional regulator [Aliidongia sp.]